MHPIHHCDHIFTLLRFYDRPIPCSLYSYASTACTGRIMFCLVRCNNAERISMKFAEDNQQNEQIK